MTQFRASLSVLSLSALLITGSCSHQNNETAMSQQTQSNKPIVALVPIIDHSHSDLTWNLSDELSRSVRERLLQRGNFYLIGEEKVQAVTRRLTDENDPFSPNIEWVKKVFGQNEFVVFMELVEHDEVPLYASKEVSAQDSAAELSMTVRVRVVDLRSAEPKIVLQELVHDTQHIPRQFTKANFYQVPWGNESFDISPLGMAHAGLTKELASRIEDYILISEKK